MKITIDLGDDKYGNAAILEKVATTGEPFFVLRAQDKLASSSLRHWANEAEKVGIDDAKVANARACAQAMMAWPRRKMPD